MSKQELDDICISNCIDCPYFMRFDICGYAYAFHLLDYDEYSG